MSPLTLIDAAGRGKLLYAISTTCQQAPHHMWLQKLKYKHCFYLEGIGQKTLQVLVR